MIAPSASVFPVTGSLSGAGGLEEIQTIAARSQNGETMSEEDFLKIGQKFEALLLNNLLTAMRKTIPENPLFGQSRSEEIYWEMFDESMAETVAQSQSTGITQVIVEELQRQQEQVVPPKGENPFRALLPKPDGLRPIDSAPEFQPVPRESEELKPIEDKYGVFRPLPGRLNLTR